MAQLVGALSREPQDCRFDSQSGHIPSCGFDFWSGHGTCLGSGFSPQLGVSEKKPIDVSLPLSPHLPLSLKKAMKKCPQVRIKKKEEESKKEKATFPLELIALKTFVPPKFAFLSWPDVDLGLLTGALL